MELVKVLKNEQLVIHFCLLCSTCYLLLLFHATCIHILVIIFIAPNVIKGQILEQIDLLSPFYNLTFDITPIAKVSKWSNIIHVTKGGEGQALGDRAPAVFFAPRSTRLVVASAINGQKNYVWISRTQLPLGKASKIEIKQHLVADKIMFQVSIDGAVVHFVENKSPRFFKGITVYASYPNYKWPAYARIANYKLTDNYCY